MKTNCGRFKKLLGHMVISEPQICLKLDLALNFSSYINQSFFTSLSHFRLNFVTSSQKSPH